jgi:hypothetical protein
MPGSLGPVHDFAGFGYFKPVPDDFFGFHFWHSVSRIQISIYYEINTFLIPVLILPELLLISQSGSL